MLDGDAGAVDPPTEERAALLRAYDGQLRGAADVQSALRWDRDGPLHRAVFERGGFVTYESLNWP